MPKNFPGFTLTERQRLISELFDLALAVRDEAIRGIEKHGVRGYESAHGGWAVIFEELDELWDEVKADRGYQESAYTEALHVAATALKYIYWFKIKKRHEAQT